MPIPYKQKLGIGLRLSNIFALAQKPVWYNGLYNMKVVVKPFFWFTLYYKIHTRTMHTHIWYLEAKEWIELEEKRIKRVSIISKFKNNFFFKS